jgi:maleate cis-trans isomerase
VVPGGNFPTMTATTAWEQQFGKPVITTNNASFWAMLRMLDDHPQSGILDSWFPPVSRPPRPGDRR